ncbi:MAG: phospholipase D-like domain-containing protein [Candidatus Thermoplasmatota archaeon]|nr:phospholipase D-like domain-containing protein [Candidatus Thermoplasmatota archaeon]
MFSLAFAIVCISAMGDSHFERAISDDSAHVLSTIPSGMVISEFYPCAVCNDEYFVLTNVGSSSVAVEGWEVTDGEGVVVFVDPMYIAPYASLVVSFNASSYLAAYGTLPEVHLDDLSTDTGVEVSGSFRLGNDGDSLTLRNGYGSVLDFVVYGDCAETSTDWTGPPLASPRTGEVMVRVRTSDGFVDADTSADWMPFREHRYGYTSWRSYAAIVDPGCLTAFLSPDCSADVVVSRLDAAREIIRVCSYEFSSPIVCEALLRALYRGVNVSLLIDGSPAGGIDERAVATLSVLAGSGASVRVLTGRLDNGVVKHVAALHSKYFVIDSTDVIVLSENAVPSGIPADRVFGNRGWGMAAVSSGLAGYLASVFEGDRREDRPGVMDWMCDARYDSRAEAPILEESPHERGMFRPFTTTSVATVTLVVSPDGSFMAPFLCDTLLSETNLVVEQFQADLRWRTRWSDGELLSPLVSSLVDCARNGVACRALLDSSWFNLERNGEVVDALVAVQSAESLDCSARLMDPQGPITVMHNKGVIVDGRRVVVSSNNWVYASFAKNRELAAVIDSPEVASYFTGAFDADWYPDRVAPVIDAPKDVVVSCGSWVTLSSESCSDDRMLVGVRWDLDADGSVDANTPSFSFLLTAPGEVTVTLTLTDSWGNEATQAITIMVVSEHHPPPEERFNMVAYASVIPAALGGALLLLILRKRGPRRR